MNIFKDSVRLLLVILLLSQTRNFYANEKQSSEVVTKESVTKTIEIPKFVMVKTKSIKRFAAVWRRIEGVIIALYDKNEYPEIMNVSIRVNKLVKRSFDTKKIALHDKEVQKLIGAWEDVELLLLSSVFSPSCLFRKRWEETAIPIDAHDIVKARNFIANIKAYLHDVKVYRLLCGCPSSGDSDIDAQLNQIINTLGTCSNSAMPLNCDYGSEVATLAAINNSALCGIVTLLRTILAELRGVCN